MAKRMFVTILLLVSIAWGAASTAGAGEEPLALVFRPEPGSVYLQSERLVYTITMSIGDGIPAELDDLLGQDLGFRVGIMSKVAVRQVDGGENSALDQTFLAFMGDTSMNGGLLNLALDTTDPFAAPMGMNGNLAAMVGEGCTYVADKRGRLVRIEGLEEMFDRLAERQNLTEREKQDLQKQWNENMSQSGRKGGSYPNDFIAGLFRDEPVRPGETWTSVAGLYLQGLYLTTENTYQLTARKDGIATIELKSLISSAVVDARPAANTDGPEMAISGGQRAVIEVDETTGWVLRIALEQNLLSSISMPDPESGGAVTGTLSMHGKYDLTSRRL